MKKITIVSRNSKLATWQAEFVKSQLNAIYPNMHVDIIGIVTQGDKILDKSLDKVGGKGLFIKELENSLLKQEADIAVHSLKDVSVNLGNPFKIAAILKRGTPNDALISNKYDNLESMPDGSIIGTSSSRRIALLKKYYPKLKCKLLRGNLTTRINRLDNDEYDGIILAAAGILRLGLGARIKQQLDLTKFIPAIGQGALAIETLNTRHDLTELLAPLADSDTTIIANSEREAGRLLNCDCSTPVGVYASLSGDNISINAFIANPDNYEICYFSNVTKHKNEYKIASKECVNKLLSQIKNKQHFII